MSHLISVLQTVVRPVDLLLTPSAGRRSGDDKREEEPVMPQGAKPMETTNREPRALGHRRVKAR